VPGPGSSSRTSPSTPRLRSATGSPALPFPLPLGTAAFGVLEGRAVRAASVGRFRGGPALARVRVRPDGPLDGLGLDGTWPALRFDEVDVLFPAPSGGATV
jgi:hypothetical protein